MTQNTRFIRQLDQDEPSKFNPDWDAEAWLDTERNKTVLVRKGRNPNNYIRHERMALLFTDQAEYYVVCLDCRAVYGHLQWSGSTRAPGWRQSSAAYLEEHTQTKGWCEFCDPVFGSGGWSLH